MPLSKTRTRSAYLDAFDDDAQHGPGAYSVQGRAHGQIPIWARIRSIRLGRNSSRSRHQAWSSQRQVSTPQRGEPELTELSSRPLSLSPIPDTPLDAPRERANYSNEPWRENVDFPTQSIASDEAVGEGGADSDETTDYSIPPELRQVRRQHSSSSPSDAGSDSPPSLSYIPPELRPTQEDVRVEDERRNSPTIDDGDDRTTSDDSGDAIINSHTRRYQRRSDILLFLIAALIGIVFGLCIGLPIRNSNESKEEVEPRSGGAPKCDYSRNGTMIPSVFLQCECDGTISMWNEGVRSQYSFLREYYIPTLLPNFAEEDESCDPTNSALWQLANDTLFGANLTDNRYLLTLLYANWDGEGWRRKKDWLSPIVTECEWEGVSCNTNNERIRSLALDRNNLGGTIPSEIGLMPTLRVMNVEWNRLSGTLPVELFQLQLLERLQLGMNYLNGSLAAVESLSLPFLDFLELDVNFFSGTIPRELGSLFSLQYLGLSDNALSGTVPQELGNLLGLEILRFDQNDLTGTLPPSLGRLASLRSFAAGSNRFRGRLFSSIGNLNELRILDLSKAGLVGTIPSELGRSTNLSMLSLDGNSFFGPLPTLRNLTELSYAFFSRNVLTGTLSPFWGSLTKLRALALDDNALEGRIPSELGRLTNLASLNLGANDLSGTAPQEVCNLRNGVLDIFIAPCTVNGVVATPFQCSVPDCCTECVT